MNNNLLTAIIYDENDNVRMTAFEALVNFTSSEIVKTTFIEALEQEQNPSIQVAIIQALVQIQGVFAELDKSLVVRKLKNGRIKARQDSETRTLSGKKKCEGRKSLRESSPDLLRDARKLYRKPPKGKRRTLEEIGGALFEMGYQTSKGNHYAPAQVKRLLGC